MATKYPGGVKITTPILSTGGRGNYELEVAADAVILTVTHPASSVTTELVLSGENAERFVQDVARQYRAARKARLKAVAQVEDRQEVSA